MNVEDLKQFAGVGLDTKTAEAYAILRLGLNPDEWCAYAWSACIDKHSPEDAIEKLEEWEEDEGGILSESFSDDLRDEFCGADMLTKHQMLVRLVKAPDIKAARIIWDDELEVEYKVCLVDWDLVQELANG